MALVPGMKVRYLPQPEWGVGHLVRLSVDGGKAEVVFPSRPEPTIVSTKAGALVPQALGTGDRIHTAKGRLGVVTGEVPGGRGLRRYEVRFDEGDEDELPESEVHAEPPPPDVLAALREGRVANARAFLLRRQALRLDEERRNDALGALLASRIMVKAHQIGVVQRVLSARAPRFILADEVGLGKTIEAGMVFSALRLSGLAARVLVVAPSHLTVQWLAELFHKFNQLFTLLDAERLSSSRTEQPGVNPWARFPTVVTSLELLARSEEQQREAASAGWDLVIIDEAHHLRGDAAFAAASALAQRTWGLLLLTATPMQLDPEEYRRLLTLLDATTAPTAKQLSLRLERQEQLSEVVRSLLTEKEQVPAAALAALRRRYPDDARLARLRNPTALLQHLAETYSLSDRLIRNRRARVGGFSERRLHRHKVVLSEAERSARARVLKAVTGGNLRGAALAGLLRRLDSSAAAFAQAARAVPAVAELASALPARDAKFLALLGLLRDVWAREPLAKVLLFTEARETLESLRELLRAEGLEALGYHGDLLLVERDRQVARFRDPEGPLLLLCTEVGGEGRNFQFAHHLVHYDLPWSPATVEQRIGRLDRIGQTHPVELHVLDVEGTLASDVLSLLADAVGVFGETVGGLDAVLESVEGKILELALEPEQARARYRVQLAKAVAEAREAARRAYDPLLDVRSFDQEEVESLVRRAQTRLGIDADEETALADALWGVARDLDERLEETVTELAERVGIGVDTDREVNAFQCAFHFGHALTVEALPGIDVSQEKTLLGTFWRDTAVEQEEIDFFATGHPLVEALFGFLRDGPYGRTGFRAIQRRVPKRLRGLEVLFHLIPPEAEDTSSGARVPSRQLSRFLDTGLIRVAVVAGPDGKALTDASVLEVLEEDGRALPHEQVRAAFPDLSTFVDTGVAEARRAAEDELSTLRAAAREALVAERDLTLERLGRALHHQGLPDAVVKAQLALERSYATTLERALEKVTLELDSVCAFVVDR
jgi:ATP-dependent helicase HepA